MDSASRPAAQAPLVLVVEEDESNRELFQLVLERAKMRVIAVRDSDAARRVTADARPDVIVADVRMPLADGATFVQGLRANPALEGVPILFVTSFLSPSDDLGRLEVLGPVHAVLKPFKPDVLVAFVGSLLARTDSRAAVSRKQAAASRATELRMESEKLAARSMELVDSTKALLRAKIVLLVEDDGAFRYAMGKMLRGAGATVVETTNLENALTALNEHPDIEAIVADVVLPDGLAPDGLKRLEQRRRLPVLYVTGYSDQLLRDYGLSARDPHLLMKPFDAETLVSRLAAIGA